MNNKDKAKMAANTQDKLEQLLTEILDRLDQIERSKSFGLLRDQYWNKPAKKDQTILPPNPDNYFKTNEVK